MSVIDYGNTYHLSKLSYFSSNPEDWNYNKLKIEDIDPYLNKPFNYNSSYIVYNGLKYCNEIFIKDDPASHLTQKGINLFYAEIFKKMEINLND
jgi:hypothetical protein